MELTPLNTRDRKEIVQLIKKQWGCDFDFHYSGFESSKNKIYIISKDIVNFPLDELRINAIGLYFAERQHASLRLSFEGAQIIGPLAEKNVLHLDDEKAAHWLEGHDVEVKGEGSAWVIVENNGDYLGCGRLKDKTLLNYVPKERRV